MAHIIISSANKYAHFNRRLATSLSRAGIDGVWFDVDTIPAGMTWSNDLERGLPIADAMIAVMSPEAMSSHAIKLEWQGFLDANRPVIPIVLVPAQVHGGLAHFTYIDFYTQSYETAFAQLYGELVHYGVKFNPITAQLSGEVERITNTIPSVPSNNGRFWRYTTLLLLVIVIALLGFIARLSDDDTPNTNTQIISPTATEQSQSLAIPSPQEFEIVTTSDITPAPIVTIPTIINQNADWTPVMQAFYDVEMVLAPEGCFMMGNIRGEDNEQPSTQICFDTPFWIDRYEVTNAQYRRCVDDGVCEPPSNRVYFDDAPIR